MVFLSKTKCLVKPIEKNTQYSTLVPGNSAKNLIGPQAHGGIVAIQGRSHRDYVNYKAKLFQGLLSGFEVWDKKFK